LYVVYRTWRIEEGKIGKIVREVRKEGKKEIRNICEGRNVCKERTLKTDEGGAHRKKDRQEVEVGSGSRKEDEGR
jgi:hypothetical protein